MISQRLEAKIIEQVAAVLPSATPHSIVGSWQPAAAGDIKCAEPADAVALVAVATSTFSRETFSIPSGSFSASVALTVRNELDPTGEAFLAFADALESLFDSWQSATYQTHFAALDVPGFSLADVSLTGAAPVRDDTAAVTSIVFNLTISGCKSA